MRELSQSYLDHSRADHRNTLARKQMIEARKEYIESQSRAKVRRPWSQLTESFRL